MTNNLKQNPPTKDATIDISNNERVTDALARFKWRPIGL